MEKFRMENDSAAIKCETMSKTWMCLCRCVCWRAPSSSVSIETNKFRRSASRTALVFVDVRRFIAAPWPTSRMLSRSAELAINKFSFYSAPLINRLLNSTLAVCAGKKSESRRVSRGLDRNVLDSTLFVFPSDAQFIPNTPPSLRGWVYNFNWLETRSGAHGNSQLGSTWCLPCRMR